MSQPVRLALLGAHYRQPLDFTRDLLRQSKGNLDRWYNALRCADEAPSEADVPFEVLAALEDDLNTPMAISHVHALATALNKATDPLEKAELKGKLLAAGRLHGILQQAPVVWFQGDAGDAATDAAAIEDLIERRKEARKSKNFAEADRIRKELTDMGIVLEDGPGGTTWKRA